MAPKQFSEGSEGVVSELDFVPGSKLSSSAFYLLLAGALGHILGKISLSLPPSGLNAKLVTPGVRRDGDSAVLSPGILKAR